MFGTELFTTPCEGSSGFSSQGPLSKSRCKPYAFDVAQQGNEETAEQDDAEIRLLTPSISCAERM